MTASFALTDLLSEPEPTYVWVMALDLTAPLMSDSSQMRDTACRAFPFAFAFCEHSHVLGCFVKYEVCVWMQLAKGDEMPCGVASLLLSGCFTTVRVTSRIGAL